MAVQTGASLQGPLGRAPFPRGRRPGRARAVPPKRKRWARRGASLSRLHAPRQPRCASRPSRRRPFSANGPLTPRAR
eukprot:3551308-Lingulodinium_polyedra.AAC.1